MVAFVFACFRTYNGPELLRFAEKYVVGFELSPSVVETDGLERLLLLVEGRNAGAVDEDEDAFAAAVPRLTLAFKAGEGSVRDGKSSVCLKSGGGSTKIESWLAGGSTMLKTD